MLGALAMIDGGEVDWKIIAIRASDPVASAVNSTPCCVPELPKPSPPPSNPTLPSAFYVVAHAWHSNLSCVRVFGCCCTPDADDISLHFGAIVKDLTNWLRVYKVSAA